MRQEVTGGWRTLHNEEFEGYEVGQTYSTHKEIIHSYIFVSKVREEDSWDIYV
jgi:hypothetical protein